MRIDRFAIYERDQGVCGFCSEPVDFDGMHLDHTVPRTDGGPTHPDNLRPSHPRCNQAASGRMRRKPPRDQPPMTLRLPADLHEALKRLAEQDDRSLHSLIVHALRQLVNERATERPADR